MTGPYINVVAFSVVVIAVCNVIALIWGWDLGNN
jgi:hypothetical protein